jgi:hypothetical protein
MIRLLFLTIISFTIILSSSFASERIPVVFDTDANNELDDQHALAYLLFNDNTFDVKAVTVNATYNGGNIEEQFAEADRVMKLCGVKGKVPLFKGANGSFKEIEVDLDNPSFDGSKAIDFIIKESLKYSQDNKLVVLAVGKLTNIALAVKKDPSIIKNIRLVWLGANYPEPGEYNLENDIPSMNYLLKTDIDFEMVTVRYGKPSGTDFVKLTKEEVYANMPKLGLRISTPIIGRHGGEFYTFGEYSISLFDNATFHGNPPTRSLFDMAAVAIVKNPKWAKCSDISCPIMVDDKWVEQPNNPRKIKIWEYFNKELIMADFYKSLESRN